MHARLVAYKDGKPDLSFVVDPAGTGIGRDAGNLIQLVSPEVSKRHARLQQTDSGWQLQDMNSRNGVFVNRRRVRETFLKNDDTVTIGPFSLVFETGPHDSQCKPAHVIDMTRKAEMVTMFTPKRP